MTLAPYSSLFFVGREEAMGKLVNTQSAVEQDQAGVFGMVLGPDNKVEQRGRHLPSPPLNTLKLAPFFRSPVPS